ncbi:unnamed protein product [Protopolystoma xenopodis]|uniref:Uncharacterized protein n=1 Tax=Protopolystoma xenopodis TaxID=117903 RepID=A0A448WBY4_9PLAT|nr:unnamed protein product [Protopolystoma xenopodis]
MTPSPMDRIVFAHVTQHSRDHQHQLRARRISLSTPPLLVLPSRPESGVWSGPVETRIGRTMRPGGIKEVKVTKTSLPSEPQRGGDSSGNLGKQAMLMEAGLMDIMLTPATYLNFTSQMPRHESHVRPVTH